MTTNCPFCGSPDASLAGQDDWWQMLCPKCNAAGPAAETQKLAESAWKRTCHWKEDNWSGSYDTGCGQKHCFIDGGPEENKHQFCPYCGKTIKMTP